jgi:hypothetical protein
MHQPRERRPLWQAEDPEAGESPEGPATGHPCCIAGELILIKDEVSGAPDILTRALTEGLDCAAVVAA